MAALALGQSLVSCSSDDDYYGEQCISQNASLSGQFNYNKDSKSWYFVCNELYQIERWARGVGIRPAGDSVRIRVSNVPEGTDLSTLKGKYVDVQGTVYCFGRTTHGTDSVFDCRMDVEKIDHLDYTYMFKRGDTFMLNGIKGRITGGEGIWYFKAAKGSSFPQPMSDTLGNGDNNFILKAEMKGISLDDLCNKDVTVAGKATFLYRMVQCNDNCCVFSLEAESIEESN